MEGARPAYLQGRGRGRGRGRTNTPQFNNVPGGGGGAAAAPAPAAAPSWNQVAASPVEGPRISGPSTGRGQQREELRSGRGQGQAGDGFVRAENGGYHKSPPQSPHSKSEPHTPESPVSPEERFQDAASKHLEAAQKHLTTATDDYESSDDEEELNDDGIIEAMLKTFKTSGSSESEALGSTQEYLMNSVKSKANVCLVCIETIKRNDPIWNCEGCYSSFHVTCIQKWVKDGVYQQTALSEDNFPNRDLPWNCPKCRHDYKQSQCPTRYYCYCGKEEDPKFDPWLVPHSCGQVCSRRLKPGCGHSCLLLCHPGPCPPCPQTVKVTCHCGKQPPQTRRCGAQQWSCGKPCQRALQCGHHSCQKPCHSGDCPPCPETSSQRCQCGRSTTLRPCAVPVWQCEQVCGKSLSCGHHTCELVCHSSQCGACPRSGKRTCPCGKSEFEMPCTEDVPTCLDTCDKTLDCGLHQCTQRCHYGPCGTCREMIKKTCRCGKKQKEIQCFKEYLCETKCTNTKDCGRHACRRKCCDGNCPSCDAPCGRTLGCHNHKCSSRCHKGRCYPCPLTVSLSCNCGATRITVPCGREKVTRPPRCNQKCRKPPDCHHEVRLPHRCHFGECPPCGQTCGKTLPNCCHSCPVVCHNAVLCRVQEKVHRAGPWESPKIRTERLNKPCPACQVLVPVTCLGDHETVPMACCEARVSSCHRTCGRQLRCGNHTCQLDCHRVVNSSEDHAAGETCQKCERPCAKPRPEGCRHRCLLPCHGGECAACEMMVRMRCHCQLMVLHIECDQWSHADDKERARLQSCHSKCPKMLSCGHQCKADCHPSKCPNPERCTEKVKVKCPCRRKKRDFLCNEVQAGYGKVECDDICQQQRDVKKKQKDEEQKMKKQEEQKRQQRELEEFEWKMGSRKRKPRKQRAEEERLSFLQRYGKFIVAPMLILLLSLFVFWLLKK